jgi:mono/diheme cytochrome c family protein
MTAHGLRRTLVAVSFCAALGTASVMGGGWAVITVDDVPEYVRSGQSFTIAYAVRQHGQHLVGGLTGRVEATSGSYRVVARAERGKSDGHYVAALTLPAAGDWSVTIHGGFATLSSLTLLPLKVVGGTAPPAALDAYARGQQLFVAKGCVMCHRVEGKVDTSATSYGPQLIPQKYQSEYLARALAKPEMLAAAPNLAFRMPNLELRAPEIAALVAFINGPAPRDTAAARK